MIRNLLWPLITCLIAFFFLPNEVQGNIKKVKLSTPRQTVETHLEYLQDDNYQPDKAARTFMVQDSARARKLAIMLKQILDAKGLYVNYNRIPNSPNYGDTFAKEKKYVLFNDYPQIYVTKENGKWYYSEETAEAIPRIHKNVFPFGTDKLVGLIPKIGQEKFLGIAIWKYLGLLILLFIAYVFYKIAFWVFNKIIHQSLKKALGDKDADRFERAISRSCSLLIILFIVNILLPILQLPVNFSHYFFIILKILIPLFMIFIGYRCMDILGVYMSRAAENTDTTLDDQIVPLVRKVLKGIVIITGFLFILQNLNFNITTVLAGLSIGGLAFALAAQETIKNLFGSLMILIDRPFQVGDFVKTDNNIIGTVEEVGLRSTRVRTFEQSLLSVPNGKLADMTIDNMQMRFQRRFYTNITITYDTPPALVETFVEGIKKCIEDHPETDKSYYIVRLNNLDSYSLNVMVWCYFQTTDWQQELKYKEELLLTIMRLAEELGVRFAFPTSTVHVEDFPGQDAKTPTFNEDKEAFRQKMDYFFQKQQGNK